MEQMKNKRWMKEVFTVGSENGAMIEMFVISSKVEHLLFQKLNFVLKYLVKQDVRH